MEFPSLFPPSSLYMMSDSWRQILQNNGDAIPDTLWRSIYFKCRKIEGFNRGFWDFWGRYSRKELERKYQDLGKQVLSSKDTPDWKNVEENLQRIYNEYESVAREEHDKWLEETTPKAIESRQNRFSMTQEHDKWYRFKLEETIPKAIESRQNRFSMTQEHDKWYRFKLEETIPKAIESRQNRFSMTQDWNRTETTEVSICVEELHGKKHVFDGVAPSDSAETLMSKIERKTKVPKHEFVLFCNGRIVEEKQTLKDYDIYTSSILLLRQKRKGKETSVSCDLRQIVWNKFDHYYKKIQNLVNKFPQFFEDTTRMLSEKDFSRISKAIGDGWQSLGMELGLDKIKLEHITANNQTLEMKIVDMLTQWSRQKPSEAKAGNLYSAIKNCTDLSCNLETLKSIVLGV